MARCECGDMPGHCPGPANCSCADDRPACRDCGERYSVSRMHSQDADDSFICEDCATAQLEQAAGCNAGNE